MRAGIFDLDGTLVDSIGDIGGAMNAALAAHGLPQHPIDAYRRFVGDGVQKLVERALGGRGELAEAVLAEYRREYAERLLATTVPYPGVLDAVDALADRGIALAVLSNKPQLATQRIVAALFPGRFRVVLGERTGVPRKPDPAAALEIAAALDVAPAATAFVGDTAVDMRTAVAAGMHPIGVLWGFRGRDEITAAGARDVIAAATELVALFA